MKRIIIVFVFFVCVSCDCRKNEEIGLKPGEYNFNFNNVIEVIGGIKKI